MLVKGRYFGIDSQNFDCSYLKEATSSMNR